MKKIKKIDIVKYRDPRLAELVIGDVEVEIIQKLNEIIDRLNGEKQK